MIDNRHTCLIFFFGFCYQSFRVFIYNFSITYAVNKLIINYNQRRFMNCMDDDRILMAKWQVILFISVHDGRDDLLLKPDWNKLWSLFNSNKTPSQVTFIIALFVLFGASSMRVLAVTQVCGR